jgi:hypothetical protein
VEVDPRIQINEHTYLVEESSSKSSASEPADDGTLHLLKK